jgi:hypothetical protein
MNWTNCTCWVDPLIIAIDFDGVIVQDAYPAIGPEVPGAVSTIQHLIRQGHRIIINTCRAGDAEAAMRIWLHRHHINPAAINQNLPERIEKYGCDTRKISADLYIDDHNIGSTETDWNRIRLIINELSPQWPEYCHGCPDSMEYSRCRLDSGYDWVQTCPHGRKTLCRFCTFLELDPDGYPSHDPALSCCHPIGRSVYEGADDVLECSCFAKREEASI